MEEQEGTENKEQAEPELLYHYTTQEGLLGIIEKGCIWATHLRYLNDTSEGEIVSRAAWEELISRPNTDSLIQLFGMPPVKGRKEIECNDEQILNQGYRILSSEVTSRDVYVTSLSKRGNLLSQWRAYSGESGGYSIGFSPNYLEVIGRHFLEEISRKNFLPDEPLIRCQYYDDEVKEQLTEKIKRVVDSYILEADKTKREFTSNEQVGSRTPAAIAIRHFRPLSLDCATTKDNAFQEEEEWRLIFRSLNRSVEGVFFRPGRSMLIPYLKIPLEFQNQHVEIKRIYVGPSPHPSEAQESVEMLLRKYGIHGVEVVPSKIPYRNW
jgi:Protein of unknown function (DUF2971)